ncbi:GD15706 [Drosophila simulans]|uniref:GD15706 n=1 Tax=Drosophila simulans TaxID=7240 RepID=B4R6B7_DROSI|nr:GD15706 [Drosophila simulans]
MHNCWLVIWVDVDVDEGKAALEQKDPWNPGIHVQVSPPSSYCINKEAYVPKMQTNVQIDSKNLRSTDDNFRSRGHHITIEVSVHLTHVLCCERAVDILAGDGYQYT